MKLTMELGPKSYDIHIEKGSLQEAASYVLPHLKGQQIAILTDGNVDRHYGEALVENLKKAGAKVFKMVIPPGEASKSIEQALVLYQELAEHNFGRKDLLVTLGGGVIGDLGGYIAATWLRGVDFFQIPTSLLAQVDSSIGGKVAIDLPYGKNLVGAFHQPKGVLIDEETLRTLEEKYFIDGMAEVIKYGAVFDEAFFRLLEEEAHTLSSIRGGQSMEEVLHRCCAYKKAVVEEDEFEQGPRALLNFGHTIGHGIEKVQEYKGYSHGEAVSIGMCRIAKAGEALGWTEEGTYPRLMELCHNTGLPTDLPEGLVDSVVSAMALDKKAQGTSIRLVLLRRIGAGYLQDEKMEDLPQILGKGL